MPLTEYLYFSHQLGFFGLLCFSQMSIESVEICDLFVALVLLILGQIVRPEKEKFLSLNFES